jgi:Cys-rich protein (TIGR01571 family)
MSETISRHSLPVVHKENPVQIANSEMGTESRPPSNLNLRHNDNSFHVLASILVEFFQERVSQGESTKTLTMKPDDREMLQRLLPRSAVWDFIDAVNYRLEVTPVIAVSPIHFLTLQCQELCFDKGDQDKNPILITYSLEKDSVALNILAVLSEAFNAPVSNFYSNIDDVVARNVDHKVSSERNIENSLDGSAVVFKSDENIDGYAAQADENSDGFVDAEIDDAYIGSDLSSESSAIKIASSKDIAEEILAEANNKDKIDDSLHKKSKDGALSNFGHMISESIVEIEIEQPTAPIHESKAEEESIYKIVESTDEQGNASDLSSDGSAVKIASSIDVAEEILAEVNDKVDEIVIVENIKTSVVIIPNEDAVSVRQGPVVSDFASNDVPSHALEKVCFENDDCAEEGEEIEVLPTLTYSIDGPTFDDDKDRNNQYDDLPMLANDKTDGTLGIQAHNFAEKEKPTFQMRDFSIENIEMGSDPCSNTLEHSSPEDKENGAAQPTGDSRVDDDFVSEKSAVQAAISPVSDSANKTIISINSVSRSIQEAAGNFFDDIRWAIDEKIIAFEDAVVDAIVAKPVKKEKFPFHLESTTGHENLSESGTFSKQQVFESIVREQIPDSEPQKRIKSQSESSGLGTSFGGIAPVFSPSASEKISQNGLTFPSDEGSPIGSHLSIPDLAQYDSMCVVDTATKQQLLLETKEALTLMKQSITPETTRFWRDHIQSLQDRLDSLRVVSQHTYQTNDLNPQPMHSRNVDFSKHEPKSTTESLNRDSPTDMSDIRSIFGIPVVPGFLQFPDTSTAQDGSSGKSASMKTRAKDTRSPRDNLEIELCESSVEKTRDEVDQFELVHINSPGIEPFDSDYEYPLVDVVAPADLPGGYHFEAEIEGQRFLATVPPGGVQQGETFTCYMRELDSVAIDIPVGDWKDGLCNLSELGWCHPVLWNALFCPLIALSQIQTRVNLDFLGRPKFSDLPYSNRFMMLTVVGFWLFTNVGLFAACNLKWSHGLELSVADICAFVLVNVAMFGFVVFVTQSTRSSVREKFMIRERQCYDLEDVCCATLCLPCIVGQMSRHTANYDDYEAVCCSKTGLPNGVRVNQEPAKVKETTTENTDGYMA